MNPLLRERRFRLPVGLRDERGACHREGVLRAATAKDELRALQDFRVYLRPESFLTLVLARTIVRLGEHVKVDVALVERLGDGDLEVLAGVYRELNDY